MTKTSMQQRSVLGSGLGWGSYLGLLALSVLLFVRWGGWMWHSTAADAHVGRFAVSYLTVLPFAAITLWLTGAFSWPRLATAVGTLWAIKLVITAPLYFAFGPRGGMFGMTTPAARSAAPARQAPTLGKAPRARPAHTATQPSGYEPASGTFAKGDITGVVTLDEVAQSDAAVYLIAPAAGHSLETVETTPITIAADAFDRSLYIGFTGAELRVDNRAKTLRTLSLQASSGGERERNVALPPQGKATFTLDKTGRFTLACRAHRDQARIAVPLLMVDHPYAVLTDARGTFKLTGVPAGEVRIAAMLARKGTVLHAELQHTVNDGQRTQLQLRLSP